MGDEAVTSSKGMVHPEPGSGQVYMTTKRDSAGRLLRADKTYRLHVPALVCGGLGSLIPKTRHRRARR
jgi:hypothetical protein